VHLSDGAVLDADLVAVGIGAEPAVEWLTDSGLNLDDGVACDATLKAADSVYAAGDVTRWTHPLFGSRCVSSTGPRRPSKELSRPATRSIPTTPRPTGGRYATSGRTER
jgi:NADPH-dependent 2,4-dienoyl-CoA reductase/sulfur reductase-like enzyme